MTERTGQAAMEARLVSTRLPFSEWGYALLVWSPMLARFLLPSSVEEQLTVTWFQVPFLATDVAWLFLPIWEWATGIRSRVRRPRAAFYYLVLAGWAAGQVLMKGEDLPVHLGTIAYVFSPLVVLSLYNFSRRGGRIHGYLLLAVALYLCLQVLGFTLQFFKWSGISLTQEYGGLGRVRSTVGASTATGVVILMVGFLGCAFRRWSRGGLYGFCALLVVGVMSTLARGAILALPLAMFPVWRRLLVRRSGSRLRDWVRLGFFAVAVAAVLHWSHLGKALQERIENIAYQGDITTGRMDRLIEAWELFESSPIVGHGLGTTFIPASFGGDSFWLLAGGGVISPHNAYVALLADMGIVGSLLFWTPLFMILARTSAQRHTSLTWCATGAVFLVCMNTETILLTFEFMGLIYLSLLSLLAYPVLGREGAQERVVRGRSVTPGPGGGET